MELHQSCGSIIFFSNQGVIKEVLLIRGVDENAWTFPKGHAEPGETPWQAALRETAEEVGLLKVELIQKPSFRINYFYQEGDRSFQKEVMFFIGFSKTKNVLMQPEEVGEYMWVDKNTALKKLTFENEKEVFKKAFLLVEGSPFAFKF